MPRPSRREHLLDCAEELYATHGVGGVSMRAIQAAAGLSVGSLRYHFETEDDLVKAVMERRIEPLMARHERLLDAVAANPNPTVREVLGALIQPLLELLEAKPERGRRYLTLMHRLQEGRLTGPVLVARWPDFAARTEGLLQKSLPHLPGGAIELRFGFAWDTILGSLARTPDLSAEGLEDAGSELVDYLTGALEAPRTASGRRQPNPG